MSLQGRNALVTGGSRGIGAQIVLDLAKELGLNVLFLYASESSASKAAEVVKSVEAFGGPKAYAVQLDIAQSRVGPRVLEACKSAFGQNFKLHVLVHNAGTSINAALPDITEEGFDQQININLKAPVFITQALQPYLAKHDNGRVIILSSISARLGQATKGVYAASKLAVESFVMCWANEFGKESGITMQATAPLARLADPQSRNALEPGPVETDMWNANTAEFKATFDQRLIASTKEISDLVLLLCDAKSRWATGSIINANSGFYNFI